MTHISVNSNETSPIYLSELTCEGGEPSLLDCSRRHNQPTGLQTCDHSQDVAVRCKGTLSITKIAIM